MRYLIIGAIVVGIGLVSFLVMRKRRARLPGPGRQQIYALRLTEYAERLRGCAEEIGQPHADVFWDMAEHAERIRVEILDDHQDLTQSRRFIHHHANLMVELVEKFVALHTKARPEHADRLEEMAADGTIGEVADVHLAYAGNQFDLAGIRMDGGPAGAELLLRHEVDVVLLTPV